ncbi:MAG: hypothetical protein H6765_10660 [Candidatus Peribacteria bacterium]|nr:MAG: hypothetical protein H6765_10660 [Candidatus Peribacteria bacterium]
MDAIAGTGTLDIIISTPTTVEMLLTNTSVDELLIFEITYSATINSRSGTEAICNFVVTSDGASADSCIANPALCPNGVLNLGEQCELSGSMYLFDPSLPPALQSGALCEASTCTIAGVCGDGYTDIAGVFGTVEACDPNNPSDPNQASCLPVRCCIDTDADGACDGPPESECPDGVLDSDGVNNIPGDSDDEDCEIVSGSYEYNPAIPPVLQTPARCDVASCQIN